VKQPFKHEAERDWRKICEEVLRETSSERLNDLLEELLDALENRTPFERPRQESGSEV
jgi:hypothetical protein